MKKLIVTIALSFFSVAAQAEMEVCNFSYETIDLAVGKEFFYPNNAAVYQSEGWYHLQRGQCVQLDPSGQRKLWLYGMGSNGSRWGGIPADGTSKHFCIDTRNRFNFEDWRTAWDIHRNPDTCHWYGGKLRSLTMVWGPTRYHRVTLDGGRPWNQPEQPTYQTQPEQPTYQTQPAPPPMDPETAPVRSPESMSPPFQPNRSEPQPRNTQQEGVTLMSPGQENIPNSLSPSN